MASAHQPIWQKLFLRGRSGTHSLPHMAFLPPSTAKRRLCCVISDIHCTDGTVGNQSGEGEDWLRFFAELSLEASGHDELVLILNGDIVDLIRTARWTNAGVYPWDRGHPRFAELVSEIMEGIITQHASPLGLFGQDGFFELLRKTSRQLEAQGTAVQVIPIVGNHDKELLVVPAARARFYTACLGWPADGPDDTYRQWVQQMYGRDSQPPWLPFYFGDSGFRLFATHGQWRDDTNSRGSDGWTVAQGWQPTRWQSAQFASFTDPCFGDTVAAGLLSGFIANTKQALTQLTGDLQAANQTALARLDTILDEMDLYRPASAGIVRILQEARSQRRLGVDDEIVRLISATFRANLKRWLTHRTTWQAAPYPLKLFLPLLWLLARVPAEAMTLGVMKLMALVQEVKPVIATQTLLSLPGFQRAYREAGFCIHTEGHTHLALEAEMQFEDPISQPNYTYINTGAWRSQLVPKQNYGYRRRGIGRALYVFDRERGTSQQREQGYFVRDCLSWHGANDLGSR